jgi:hypothetical protein
MHGTEVKSNYSILDLIKKGNAYSLKDIFGVNLKNNLKFDKD